MKPTSVVTAFPTGNSIRFPEDLMDKLRLEMYGERPKDISDAIGCSVATIYGIRSGRTKWPRPGTLFPLLRYFGYEIRLVRKGTGRLVHL